MRGKNIRLKGTVWQRANGNWSVLTSEVFDPTVGRKRRIPLGTFESQEKAEEARRTWVLSGAATPPSRERPAQAKTVGSYLSNWLEDDIADAVRNGQLRQSTASSYEQVVRNHITPYLGDREIAALGRPLLRDWLNWLRDKRLSDRTVEKVYRVLHRAFADSDLPDNPARLPRKDRPKVRRRREVVRPTVVEVRAFLSHVGSCERVGAAGLYPLWLLMATTGLRRSEACGLGWDDLDLSPAEPVLTVRRGLHGGRNGFHVALPKTIEGARVISLSRLASECLRTRRVAVAGQEPVKVNSVRGAVELDLVFRWGPKAGPLPPDGVTRWFAAEWRHAGLRSGVTLHALRHSHASALLQSGMSPVDVAARLGHSPQVLLSIYGRALGEQQRNPVMRAATERLYGGDA